MRRVSCHLCLIIRLHGHVGVILSAGLALLRKLAAGTVLKRAILPADCFVLDFNHEGQHFIEVLDFLYRLLVLLLQVLDLQCPAVVLDIGQFAATLVVGVCIIWS